MNRIITIILSCILFTSCKQYGIEVTKIDIVDGIRQSKKIPLSVVTDDILLIPLETLNESIIAKILEVFFFDNYIIVIDDLPQILLFDKTGKFVRKIGNKEDGTSELSAVYFSIVTDEKLFVWDLHLNTTFGYDLHTGKSIKTLTHKFIPAGMEYFNDSLLAYYCSMPPYPGVPFSRLHFISPDFEKSDSMWYDTEYSALKRDFFYEGRVNTYLRNGNMYIWDSNIDTVFYLNNNFEKKPGYKFFLGRHALPEDDKYNSNYVNSMKDDEFMITRIMETDRFFFIEGLFGRRHAKNILYDKTTKKSRDIIFNLDLHDIGFHNDIDGSIPFWPKGQVSQNVLYDYISPYELKQLMNDPYYKTIKFRDKEQNERIRNCLSSAKVTDNPIIFLATVKNE
jgi:hypothetical protein